MAGPNAASRDCYGIRMAGKAAKPVLFNIAGTEDQNKLDASYVKTRRPVDVSLTRAYCSDHRSPEGRRERDF